MTLPLARLISTARVARTWHTRPLASNGKPAFLPGDARAFRRAYVETMVGEKPVELGELPDGSIEWRSFGVTLGRIDAQGAFRSLASDFRASLAPRVVRDIVADAHVQRVDRIKARYAALRDGEELSMQPCPVFHATSRATLRKFVVAAMKRFTRRLQPDALRILRSTGITDAPAIETLSRSDEAGRRVRQAFDAYPAISTALLGPAFMEAMIEGRSIVQFAAEDLDVPPAVIRRYRGLTVQRVFRGRWRGERFRWSISRIGLLPDHLRPVSAADHQAAMDLFSCVPFVRNADDVRSLTRGVKAPLAAEQRMGGLVGLEDVHRCLSAALGDPKASPFVLASLSLSGLVRLNRNWHRAHRTATAIEHGRSVDEESKPWQGLLEGPVALGALKAVELTTEEALHHEGWRLAHCVGSYAPQCRQGLSRIVSLRTAGGESVSTIELGRYTDAKGRPRLRIRQHHGRRNSPAPSNATRAANALLRGIHAGRIPAMHEWPSTGPDQYFADWTPQGQRIREAMDAFWAQEFPAYSESIRSAARERDARIAKGTPVLFPYCDDDLPF